MTVVAAGPCLMACGRTAHGLRLLQVVTTDAAVSACAAATLSPTARRCAATRPPPRRACPISTPATARSTTTATAPCSFRAPSKLATVASPSRARGRRWRRRAFRFRVHPGVVQGAELWARLLRQVLSPAASPQVAPEQYRAEPYRPAAATLYTADNLTTAQALAANLLTSPNLNNSALLANVTAQFNQGLSMVR